MYLKLFCFGFLIHLILIYAVFDIYYVSPIVTNARSHVISTEDGPAQRLVIFSADGLRSRAFFDHPEKSPFLQNLIKNNSAIYGISKSHVPTESRPGHVAIFAGFFEDVSAVARGWKHNPIKFDSIFNQTRRAWLFGSPDIVLMFGEELKHVSTFHYSADEEQFFGTDAAGLDRWVFEKVKELFANESNNLSQPKSIFFLHLLGIDSNGHGHKPYSKQYVDNIRIVDDGVSMIYMLFERYFNDKKTAYLFTSDHGMTDFGSHGAGEDDEILTPLVAWGAGIRPLPSAQVVNQIDLTSLQAALLNVPVPTNNFGILPLGFLNVSKKYKFQAACGNLKQMVEQYGLKRSEKLANSLPFMFQDYPGFKASALNRVEDNISNLVAKKRYDMAANQCLEWTVKVRSAFMYFHRYNRSTLGVAISSIFVLWNMFLYMTFSKPKFCLKSSLCVPAPFFTAIMLMQLALGTYQRWPLMHQVYVTLPVYLVAMIKNLLVLKINSLVADVIGVCRLFTGQMLGYLAALSIVMVALISAFFSRGLVSGILIFMAPMPYFAFRTRWSTLWSLSCLLLAVFPQCQPVGQSPFLALTVVSPLLHCMCLHFYKSRLSRSSALLFNYFVVINALTSLVIAYSGFVWLKWSSTPAEVKLFAWFAITLNLGVPLLADTYLCDRVVLWMSAVNVPYSLMSISYESFFYLVFCVLLFVYIQLEQRNLSTGRLLDLRHTSKKSESSVFGPFTTDEWRRALTLLALVEIAFFGTGNLSSLNSFNPSFIRNFVATFSPFLMTALLVVKIALPFFVLICSFNLVLYADGKQVPERVSVLLFIITNSMAMVFFHFLKDEGSWLEIGISISNYIISMLTAAIVFLLFHLSNKIYTLKLFDLYNVNSLDQFKYYN